MLQLEVPWPPSVNTLYATFRGRRILSRKGREYHKAIEALWLEKRDGRMPLTGRLKVLRIFYPPDRRRRDISNLSKALDDSLTKAGVWVDDSQIDDERNVRMHVVPGGQAIVLISVLPEVP